MSKFMDLFASLESSIIFICYIVFCIGQGILVKASNSNEGYKFNTVCIVFLTELTKLVLALLGYLRNNSLISLWSEIINNLKIFCHYLVPSFLYCIYNNLVFVNLSHFDPTSYFILLQLKVVATGIIFQIIFKKKFTKLQWMSLILLTCGCMIQEITWDDFKYIFSSEVKQAAKFSFFSIYFGLIIIQTLCSCFAGVYNELILKETGAKVNVFTQNILMYVDSIFWNLIVLAFQGNVLSVFSVQSLSSVLQPLIIAIILNNSFIGITTSFFLKNLNSILKNFASAIELVFTPFLTWIIFGVVIKLNTFVAIVIIIFSLYIYSKNPVINKGKILSETPKENKKLLEEV